MRKAPYRAYRLVLFTLSAGGSALLVLVLVERYGKTLRDAVSQGDVKALRRLLKRGADVHAKDWWGLTALHWAADRGRADLVKLLLKKGADANAKDKDGKTPLDLARKEEMRALLLKHIQAQD